MPKANELYSIFHDDTSSRKRTEEYERVLEQVQKHCSKEHSSLIINSDNSAEDEAAFKSVISEYIAKNNLLCDGYTVEDLTSRLFADMAGYSFLADYIYADGVEEVNVNAFDDIEVIYASGKSVKIPEKFNNAQQAKDVVRRMLSKCGIVIDETVPSVLGYLEKNIRISADIPPIVDEDVGISVSIRIVNQASVTREKLLEYGSGTPEMLDFLEACINHGVSVCFAGATGSGKTTLMAWLLSNVPNNFRLITIEEGSRELNCIKRDEQGNAINSVTHLLTRPHTNPEMNIDQDLLLERTLRKNPDVIGVGEMRSYEAMTAAEASRTGHTVTTTIHSNSAAASYRRMMTLAKKKYSTMDDKFLMHIMVEAFPVVVYTKQLQNGSRKIMEIIEGTSYDEKEGEVKYTSLYKYDITRNKKVNGETVIVGKHKKTGVMSSALRQTFLDNGLSEEELAKFLKKGE